MTSFWYRGIFYHIVFYTPILVFHLEKCVFDRGTVWRAIPTELRSTVKCFSPGSKAAHCLWSPGQRLYVVIKERNQILIIWPCVWTSCEWMREDVDVGVLLCICGSRATFICVNNSSELVYRAATPELGSTKTICPILLSTSLWCDRTGKCWGIPDILGEGTEGGR
jgi:hypothetical protein